MSAPASGAEPAPGVQSLVWGFPSCRLVRAVQHAVPSGFGAPSATSSCLAGKSSTVVGDVGAAHAAHMVMRWDGEAWVGNATAADSTWTAVYVATAADRTDSCADHVARERQQTPESWIAAYGRTWEGTEGEAFGRRPSCRECLLVRFVSCQSFAKTRSSPIARISTRDAARGGDTTSGGKGRGRTYLRMYIRYWHLACCRDSDDCNNPGCLARRQPGCQLGRLVVENESTSMHSAGVAVAAASDALGADPGAIGEPEGDAAGGLYSTVANGVDVGKKADPVAGGGDDAA
jgi:hypothetical protein